MLKFISVLALLGLAGCATKAPKEDLRDVYQLVRERKFDQAEAKLVETSGKSMLGQFDSYSGVTVKAISDSGDYPFKRIQGTIDYCDTRIQEIKKVSTDRSDEDGWDKFKLQEASDDFSRQCSENDESVVEAQSLSSVDFQSMFKEMNIQFSAEEKRITKQFSQKEENSEKDVAEATANKEKYEQSEEYYSKKLCEMNSIIKTANSIIDREKDAAKVSGFVNKKKMYEAGQAVTINQRRIQHFSAEYKGKFGKPWSASACN